MIFKAADKIAFQVMRSEVKYPVSVCYLRDARALA